LFFRAQVTEMTLRTSSSSQAVHTMAATRFLMCLTRRHCRGILYQKPFLRSFFRFVEPLCSSRMLAANAPASRPVVPAGFSLVSPPHPGIPGPLKPQGRLSLPEDPTGPLFLISPKDYALLKIPIVTLPACNISFFYSLFCAQVSFQFFSHFLLISLLPFSGRVPLWTENFGMTLVVSSSAHVAGCSS